MIAALDVRHLVQARQPGVSLGPLARRGWQEDGGAAKSRHDRHVDLARDEYLQWATIADPRAGGRELAFPAHAADGRCTTAECRGARQGPRVSRGDAQASGDPEQ